MDFDTCKIHVRQDYLNLSTEKAMQRSLTEFRVRESDNMENGRRNDDLS